MFALCWQAKSVAPHVLALTSRAKPRHFMLHHLRALRPPLGLGWRRFASKNAHLMLSGEQPLKQAVLTHLQALVAQHEDVSSRMVSEGYLSLIHI